MPNELSIQAVSALPGPAEKAAEPKADSFVAPQATAPPEMPQPFINPTLHLDAGLGLVVIEFRDESGNMTSSIPSQRQIEAYRMHEQVPPGQKHGSASLRAPQPGMTAGQTGAHAAAAGAPHQPVPVRATTALSPHTGAMHAGKA